MQSEYMHWAKLQSGARFNLATSGVGPFPLSGLPVRIEDLEINGPNSYGYEPLLRAIAAKHGVEPECVVSAAGTSMANYLAMAALLEPGDEVLIEEPAYELLVSAASNLGATVRRFPRAFENDYALDPGAVESALTPKTRLVIVTNLHNPSSVYTPPDVLQKIGALARGVGAMVLVDEVYLDAMYEDAPASAIHLGPEFLVTSSLTKVYGVSGVRCGWVLARPELAQRMWRLNDLMGSVAAYMAERVSYEAMQHLSVLRDRARAVLERDRRALAAFLARCPELRAAPAPWGTTCFPRVEGGDAGALVQRLREHYETSVVPGRFFDEPRHFRIGMGVDHEQFAEGLARVGQALRTA